MRAPLCEIVSISFDCDRFEVIELMKERGTAIKEFEVNKIKEIEKQLDDIEPSRPLSAFVTFAESDSVQQIQVNASEDSPVRPADIPANIKWENRQAENQGIKISTWKNRFKITSIISLTLLLVFILRYFTTKYVSPYRRIDCTQMMA